MQTPRHLQKEMIPDFFPTKPPGYPTLEVQCGLYQTTVKIMKYHKAVEISKVNLSRVTKATKINY